MLYMLFEWLSSVGGCNFGSVDIIILFKNMLLLNVLSIAISQPSNLEVVRINVYKKLLCLVIHIYCDFNVITIICNVFKCSLSVL